MRRELSLWVLRGQILARPGQGRSLQQNSLSTMNFCISYQQSTLIYNWRVLILSLSETVDIIVLYTLYTLYTLYYYCGVSADPGLYLTWYLKVNVRKIGQWQKASLVIFYLHWRSRDITDFYSAISPWFPLLTKSSGGAGLGGNEGGGWAGGISLFRLSTPAARVQEGSRKSGRNYVQLNS